MADRETVLVLGATGGVGRTAAIEACKRGAMVWLGMRDTNKTIDDLSKESEEKLGFSRVQADLSQPESLKKAVEQSGATIAFAYCIHQSEDHMRGSFRALKEAGIKYIVLLSSYSVKEPVVQEKNMENFIPRVHAQTEIALEETGIPYTAVRPAYFNTNILWDIKDIKKGEVEVLYPDIQFDYIAPEDIGTVVGALLAERRLQNGGQVPKSIYLCGPELMSQKEAFNVIAHSLGRNLKVKEIGEAEWLEKHGFLPVTVKQSLINNLRESLPPKTQYPQELYEDAAGNIRRYAKIEPTRLQDWVRLHEKELQ